MSFCASCGAEMPANSTFCPHCGTATNSAAAPAPVQTNNFAMGPKNNVYVPNNLVKAILVTVFCCWPLGIFSIINAAKVDSLLAQGNISAAQEASDKANKFANWGMISIGIFWILYILFFVGVFITAAAAESM